MDEITEQLLAEENQNLMAEEKQNSMAEENQNLMAEENQNVMADQRPRKMKVILAMSMSNIPGYQNFMTSRSSQIAFDWIVDIIKRTDCSAIFKFFLVHVQVPKPSTHNRIPCFGSLAADEYPEAYKQEAERFLMKLQIKCNQATIESEPIIKRGVPEQKLCEAVKELEPDLLVMGNRGLSAFRRLYVKSVSKYVAKHAGCPVIRIKRSAERMIYPDDPVPD